MKNSVATFEPQDNMDVRAHRRSNGFYKQLTVVTADLKQPVICKFYKTELRVYCCFWCMEGNRVICTGSAFASGTDSIYRLERVVVQNALKSAGITLNENIEEAMYWAAIAADEAIDEALFAVAREFGYYDSIIVRGNA